jgi:Integrase zinc binding domain
MASLFAQPYFSPPGYDTVEFPSKKDILLVQQSAFNEYERCQQINAAACQQVPPQQVDAGGTRMMNNALWIPECAVKLEIRLRVEAHCRSAAHSAYEATLGAIKEYVSWTTMAKDVKVFVQNCLHCVATIPDDRRVRSYMRPSPMRSCTSTSCTSGCQATGSISTCYFSRMT